MDLKESDILGDHIGKHWYYISKSRAMLEIIKDSSCNRVLDVGAGSGFFSKVILDNTDATESWCVDIMYIKEENTISNGKPIYFVHSINDLDVDLVLLMDVLEHVDDDNELLRTYVDKVPSGTRFLVSVPAFNWLWSPHDVFLQHRRRYTLPQVENLVNVAGLAVEKTFYYYSLVLPLAIVSRMFNKYYNKTQTPRSQLKKHHFLINGILKVLCRIDLFFAKINKIAGLTIFCYAVKK